MYTSFIGIYARPDMTGHIEKTLATMVEVVELYEMGGPFELLAKAESEKRTDAEALAMEVLALEGVEKTFNLLAIGDPQKGPGGEKDFARISYLGLRIVAGNEGEVERSLLSVGGLVTAYLMAYPYELFLLMGAEDERALSKIIELCAHTEGVYSLDEFPVIRRLTP